MDETKSWNCRSPIVEDVPDEDMDDAVDYEDDHRESLFDGYGKNPCEQAID